MDEKPTYEELRQRVNTLELAESQHKVTTELLTTSGFIIRSASSVIAVSDLDSNMTYVNTAFLEAWGFSSPDEVMGRPFTEFWMVDDRIDEVLNALLGEEKKWSAELQAKRKDGSFFDVVVAAATVLDDEGNPIALTSTSIDISDRKHAEKQLKLREHQLAESQRVAAIGSWQWNLVADEVVWSDELHRLFGVGRDEFGATYQSYMDFVHPDDKAFADKIVSDAAEARKDFKFDARIVGADGSEWIMGSIGKVTARDDSGKPLIYAGTAQDITERKHAELELARYSEQLEVMVEQRTNELRQSQKMQAIGTLTGGIAHEFNNLLTPIIGIAQILLSEKSEGDPDYAHLEVIHRAGSRAASLVHQLLAYGRQSQSQREYLQLETIVEDTISLMKNTTPSNISIKKEIDVGLPSVFGMPNEINQVILNLCINASQAMPVGGEITIRAKNAGTRRFTNISGQSSEGDFLILSVQDTGLGMKEETMSQIFDPFFTTKNVGQGTGLGLSVVQGIVEQHGGYIDVDSAVGEGSTFTIYLPISQKSAEVTAVEIELVPGGGESVLLIDDEPMVIYVVKNMLKQLGYKVTDFLDCEEALRQFVEHPLDFDLVIMDYGMPKINGKQLAEQLKEVRPDVPVILITGYADLVAKEDVSAWGIDGLLMKPLIRQELSEAVRAALNKASAEL